jgi:transcriptional regulator with XRE-family HTH domain
MDSHELRAWRKARGMNQAELGKALGYSRQSVIAWEAAKTKIPDGLLVELEAANPSPAAVISSPAVLVTTRWRAYPWALRDYTAKERDQVSVGSLIWRLHTDVHNPQWEVLKVVFRKHGENFLRYENAPLITLPAGAFPDPLGEGTPWAKDAIPQLLADWQASEDKLRGFRKKIGVPELKKK